MPTLQIGRTEIPYELRRSATAAERRITVTPGRVEVLALTDDDEQAVAGFLDRKRQWLFNTVREMERTTANRHAVPRLITGSKIPYRGRRMPLTVRRTDAERTAIQYSNGFVVELPGWAPARADELVASELKLWLRQRARRDVREMAAVYEFRFGLVPASIRATDLTGCWGACGRGGHIAINWLLIFAPRKVMNYAVAHELAHLRHRSHGPDFWRFVSTICPDWETSARWLDRHQASLSDEFLQTALQRCVGE
ncbi:M48 family metallopeptidase [Sphingosinithalassobacter sp. LHW66-3]|uniref:M48 family metallopeptidase n=1 Tax=Sphingosinithalassobacter sp. LHW66-3 TaxID=3424718 RepID=UPI003D6A36F7